MKAAQMAKLVALAAVLVAIVFSCAEPAISIDERLNMFMSDVNNGRYDRLFRHVHPDSSSDKLRPAAYWQVGGDGGIFEPGATYQYSILNSSGSSRVIRIDSTTATDPRSIEEGENLQVEMFRSGDDWYIYEMRYGSERLIPPE